MGYADVPGRNLGIILNSFHSITVYILLVYIYLRAVSILSDQDPTNTLLVSILTALVQFHFPPQLLKSSTFQLAFPIQDPLSLSL